MKRRLDLSFRMMKRMRTASVESSANMDYRATNPGLGTLEKFPAEIRDQIFELAIDVDKPLSMRECCRAYSGNRYAPKRCPDHQRPSGKRASRLALLWTSREISAAAKSILHRKVTVHLKAHPHLVKPKRSVSDMNEDPIWVSVSYFRAVEIEVAPEFVHDKLYLKYLPALYDFTNKVLSYHNGRESNLSETNIGRRFTLNLGRMFDTCLPFGAKIADYAGSKITFPPIFATESLTKAVELILKPELNSLTITAVTLLGAGNPQRESYLERLRQSFEEQGAVFKENNPQAFLTPLSGGGTHIRFTA